MGKKSWLVAGIIPGVERQPLKKLAPDEDGLLKLLERWRAEAEKAGHKIARLDGLRSGARDRGWDRDGGYAGAGGVVAQFA